MAGETRRRSARRHVPTMPRIPAQDAARATDKTAAAAIRVAAMLAFAMLAASGASIHALVFWAAALFLIVRFGDLEGFTGDDDGDR